MYENEKMKAGEWGIPPILTDTWFGRFLALFSKWECDCETWLSHIDECRGMVDAYEQARRAGDNKNPAVADIGKAASLGIMLSLQGHIKTHFHRDIEPDIGKIRSFLRRLSEVLRDNRMQARMGAEAMRRFFGIALKACDLPQGDQEELHKRTDELMKAASEEMKKADEQGKSRFPILSKLAQDIVEMHDKRVYEAFKDDVAKTKTQSNYIAEHLRKDGVTVTRFDGEAGQAMGQLATLTVNAVKTTHEINNRLPDPEPRKHRYGITLDEAATIMREICIGDAVTKKTLSQWLKRDESPKSGLRITPDDLRCTQSWQAWCESYHATMTNRLKKKIYLDGKRHSRK